VTIEPNVFFGPGVTVADNVSIRANCHLDGRARRKAARSSGRSRGFARAPHRRQCPYRQFRRGEERRDRRRRQGEPPRLHRRRPCRRRHEHRRRHDHRQLRRVRQAPHRNRRQRSIGSNSAWSRRLRSAMAPMSRRAASSLPDVPADALAVARGRQEVKPGWAKKFKERKVGRETGSKRSRDRVSPACQPRHMN
jgi:bifunctional UDP-N-acetylglucosamine pyrophosphorylase / glucosamine-1-phosphate N-acetyltransferase